MSTMRIQVTKEQAALLAGNLGDHVRMELGGIPFGWWKVRRVECQPGTGWLHVVLEEPTEPAGVVPG
jgi:hypothetical protein